MSSPLHVYCLLSYSSIVYILTYPVQKECVCVSFPLHVYCLLSYSSIVYILTYVLSLLSEFLMAMEVEEYPRHDEKNELAA